VEAERVPEGFSKASSLSWLEENKMLPLLEALQEHPDLKISKFAARILGASDQEKLKNEEKNFYRGNATSQALSFFSLETSLLRKVDFLSCIWSYFIRRILLKIYVKTKSFAADPDLGIILLVY